MAKIIDPCRYVENCEPIFEFLDLVTSTGNPISLRKLELILDETIKSRDALTEKERGIISEIYRDKSFEMIRSGEYLEEIYQIVREASDEEDRNEDETREDYIKRKMTFGSITLKIKSKIMADKERREDMQRGMEEFLGNILNRDY